MVYEDVLSFFQAQLVKDAAKAAFLLNGRGYLRVSPSLLAKRSMVGALPSRTLGPPYLGF